MNPYKIVDLILKNINEVWNTNSFHDFLLYTPLEFGQSTLPLCVAKKKFC